MNCNLKKSFTMRKQETFVEKKDRKKQNNLNLL